MLMVSIFLLEDPICKNPVALGIILGINSEHSTPERTFLCNRVLDLGLSEDLSVFGPAPGFMVGPSIPGPAPICYLPVPPLSAIRGPHPPSFVPHPLNPGAPLPPSKTHTLSLRDNIIKQIEYYFSDENLKKDRYLISLMDDQGWVPITTIADFKRVKKMCTDIAFIIDSLLGSTTVEVQVNLLSSLWYFNIACPNIFME
ncbi:la-related protein 1A-like [Malus sylvestris]|uniref:la-related protein 1A-like n=1 Tax=Malus sylvestris TaxID=3752 RepID=UPI0021AC828A|nr:la-related protein 1A-like [Malus sylvestris]